MRRITVVLDIGVECDVDVPVDKLADLLVEEIEFWVPTLPWSPDPSGIGSAVVTRVAVSRASEQ